MSVGSHSYGLSVVQQNSSNLSEQLSVTKKNIHNFKLPQPSKGYVLATHNSLCLPWLLVAAPTGLMHVLRVRGGSCHGSHPRASLTHMFIVFQKQGILRYLDSTVNWVMTRRTGKMTIYRTLFRVRWELHRCYVPTTAVLRSKNRPCL